MINKLTASFADWCSELERLLAIDSRTSSITYSACIEALSGRDQEAMQAYSDNTSADSFAQYIATIVDLYGCNDSSINCL